MRSRKQRSSFPLYVLWIVFCSVGAGFCLIVAPMLRIITGIWLPAQIIFVIGALLGLAGIVCGVVYSRINQLYTIASLLNSSSRIKVNNMANQLALTVFKAQMLISRCMAKGLVDGYHDQSSGEFFTMDAFLQQLNIFDCPHFAAPTNQIHMMGDRCQCEACGRRIEYTWVTAADD